MKKFHPDNTLPRNNEIFVFGSNLAGRHGAGAAKLAKQRFGAEYGIGVGLRGNSYAIPTKDKNLKTLSLNVIDTYICDFLDFANTNPDKTFFVTRIGCGLAGYVDSEIAPLFMNAPINCDLPIMWKEYV